MTVDFDFDASNFETIVQSSINMISTLNEQATNSSNEYCNIYYGMMMSTFATYAARSDILAKSLIPDDKILKIYKNLGVILQKGLQHACPEL